MAWIIGGGFGEIGEERYLISVYYLPRSWKPEFDGEPTPDDLRTRTYTRATRDAAMKFATQMIPEDFFGCPIVEHQRLEWVVRADNTADWETLETIYAE